MRVALFDIDGTLVNTHGAGRRAVTRALREELAVELDPAIALDGKTDPQIIQEAIDRAGRAEVGGSIEAVCRRYLPLLRKELAKTSTRITVLPGVAALLRALDADASVLLGLLTGNIRQGAQDKLTAAGLDFGRFRVGAFGSDSPDRLELPAVARAGAEAILGSKVPASELVVIGDTPADVACGRGFGARTIAVATGRYDPPQLRAEGADVVFEALRDTGAVLDAILGG